MSHAMLYHAFHVQGYRLVKWEFDEHKVLMRVEPQQHKVCCSACGGRNVIRHGESTRWLRNLPIGGDLTWVIVTIPRVECSDCGMTRQIKTGLSKPRVGYTHAFARYVVELCHHMTIQDVAQHLGVSWDVVKGIHKEFLAKRFAKPPLAEVREIAIDEICVGKKRFLTIVLDLATGAILFVGQGKKGDTLLPFWRRVKRNRCRIEAVAVDFGKAYIAAVQRHLPDAVLVFDRFHIVKLFNEKLTQLRRDLFRQATDDLQKKVLKGIRWLLLKNSGHLDDERGERHRLEEALRLKQSPTLPAVVVSTLPGIRCPCSARIRQIPARPPTRLAGLVRPPHFHWSAGRHQQQDQNSPTNTLRLPRPPILLPPSLQSPQFRIQARRMNYQNSAADASAG